MVDNSWGGLPTKVLDILPPWLTNLTTYNCKKNMNKNFTFFLSLIGKGGSWIN